MMSTLWSLCTVALAATAPPPAVLYVDDDAPPGGDGLSWNTAYRFLQNALLESGLGTEVRVAGGVYRPDRFEAFPDGTGDREDSFVLGPSEAVRGGYAGLGAPNPDLRDPDLYETVLTGDLGEAGSSYHVVWGSEANEFSVLDGFVITAGLADGAFGLHDRGAGMYLKDADPTVSNCTFLENTALFSGGGMWNGQAAMTTILGCRFVNNEVTDSNCRGAALQVAGSSPLVIGCRFVGNRATGDASKGGAIDILGDPAIINCAFIDNEADGGGALYNIGNASEPTVINSTFSGNAAGLFGGSVMFSGQGSPTFDNCILWGNEGDQLAGASTPTLRYCTVEGGWSGEGVIAADPLFVDPGSGDYRLSPASPCIDAADNTAVPPDVVTDLDGNPRFLDIPEVPDTGNGDLPIVDMGAYESLGGGCLAVTNLETVCHGDGSTFTVNLEGLNACTGGTTMATFTGAGGAVGEDFCATLIVNTEQGGYCCSTQVCVPVPDCAVPALPGDLNGDGWIGVPDVLLLLDEWGSCPECGTCAADVDGDCEVGVGDFLLLLAGWT